MKHSRSGKENHGRVRLQQLRIIGTNVREIKHVSFDKRFLNLLISPVYEQFVVKVSFFSQSAGEIYRVR
jgi:hypothetical protein